MTIVTKTLGAAPGIQFQGTKDQSEVSSIGALSTAVFLGEYKRGRLDRAFAVTTGNIKARLGYDPTNPDYMAVQDCLDAGVPQVYVRRIRSGLDELAAESGDFDDYTLPTIAVHVNAAGAVSLNGASPVVSIDYQLHDVIDAGYSLDVAFFYRPGVSAIAATTDVVARLTFKDATTGDELYRISGTLSERNGSTSLEAAAEYAEVFESFTVTITGDDDDAATACFAGAAGNLPNSLGRDKTTLTISAAGGVGETVPASYYDAVYQDIQQMENLPDYLVVAKSSTTGIWNLAARLIDKLNIHALQEIDGSNDLDAAIATAEAMDAADYRATFFYNPHKARLRDATGIRGARAHRPVVGVQVAYRLLRNAATDGNGIPPIHVPVGGYDYPVRFRGMVASPDVILDESALNLLAEAKINPVVFERYQGGSRFIFGDVLTQYTSDNSALRLANAAEIATFTENVVIQIVRRHLLKNSDGFITSADRDCRRFLDNCVTAGLLVDAEDLDGFPYTLSLTPREDRPFDAVEVSLARRPEGATRAVYFNSSVNK